MKALVMGCGNIGSVAAEDLAVSMSSLEVVVADKDEAKAKSVAERIGRSNVSWVQVNAMNHAELVDSLEGFDVILGFLPGDLGFRLTEACIDAGKDLVDVSYMEENPLTLNDEAAKADVTVVPDCGLAPGISNFLVGHAVSKLDKVGCIGIMVGGLPEKPVPPLGYTITWSPESLIDEYTRKARIVRKGKVVEVEALTGVEEVVFPGVGKLEAFYMDGLRTLLETMKNVGDMWEKTLRYQGHVEKIGLLRDLGFFDERQVDVDGAKLAPRKLTARLFEQRLRKPGIRDVVALRVEVSGFREGKRTSYAYHLLDLYDDKRNTTAMARTTGSCASVVAQLIARKVVKVKGVVPPEVLGKDERIYREFRRELEKRNIAINEKISG